MDGETCGICGGDGRIGNSLGRSTATCPGCHGSGRRDSNQSRFRDVTKTKQSHHMTDQQRTAAAAPQGPKEPTTVDGMQLAAEVSATGLADDSKKRLIAEIMSHESTHGRCTQTFLKKMRKQLKGSAA